MGFMRTSATLVILLAGALAGCGSDPGPLQAHGKSVDHWLHELKSPEVKARKKAVVALGHVASADARAIPALTGAVKDKDATIRNEAVLALLNIGPAAAAAVPVLREAAQDKNATVRSNAAKALARIQGGT